MKINSNLRLIFLRFFILLVGLSFAAPAISAQQTAVPLVAGANRKADLVELNRLDSTIKLDVRYATANNFVGRAVYSEPRAFLQKPVADALLRVHRKLKQQNLGVVVYDGYRPWSVTKLFWDVTSGDKRDFVADPSKGSKHNRGAAVDLGLYDLRTGETLEMPSDYDEFTERAFPNYAGGTAQQRENRDLLRREMEAAGFAVNQNEWWHFDYKDWQEYQIYDIPFSAVRDLDQDFKTAAIEEKKDWKRHFDRSNVTGGIAIYDLRRNKFSVYDRARFDKGFVPASTFKILNSLIFLETGALRDENQIIEWDNVKRDRAEWNADQNLRSGFKFSALWAYQKIARQVGAEKIGHYVRLSDYGNRDIGGAVDRFWINGDLRITPREQILFLKRLHENRLPFSRRAIDIVKDISIAEKTGDYVLRAKTGLANAPSPGVGWYVGYVTRGADAYFFAVEIDIRKDADVRQRIELARSVLRDSKIIE